MQIQPCTSELWPHIWTGFVFGLVVWLWPGLSVMGQEPSGQVGAKQEPQFLTVEVATKALTEAAEYFETQVSNHGGYVYFVTADLKHYWGEGPVSADTIVVQPPGTPTVGLAYLEAYKATGQPQMLVAALKAGEALIRGQLESGGWRQTVDFNPTKDSGRYRFGAGGRRNQSSLDDGQTQTALTFLMRLDAALGFGNPKVHDAVEYGMSRLLAAQFASGAFPQVWEGPARPLPVVNASYPEYDWRSEGRIKNYWDYPTLNDGLAGSVAETLIVAHEVYDDSRYLEALRRLGNFLIAAQMPAPQKAWCQQYNEQMKPMWARKFEPPAISGWESQDAIMTLLRIAEVTGDMRYISPIESALRYFEEECVDKEGRVARFYELRTNRPLYLNQNYELSYDLVTAPAHYGWSFPFNVKRYRNLLKRVENGQPLAKVDSKKSITKAAELAVTSLDDHSRWVSTYAGERLVGQPKFKQGEQYLSSQAFSENMVAISKYLQMLKTRKP